MISGVIFHDLFALNKLAQSLVLLAGEEFKYLYQCFHTTGLETTGALMSFLLAEIGKHPEVAKK